MATLFNLIFFIFFTICHTPSFSYTTTSSSSRVVSYTTYCNSVVPKSTRRYSSSSNITLPQLKTGYFHGGDKIIPQNNTTKSLQFSIRDLYQTELDDTIMVDGYLALRVGDGGYKPKSTSTVGRWFKSRRKQFHPRTGPLRFSLNGVWSKSTGKLCMVGTGTGYSKEGNLLHLSVVFKLDYPKISTIKTSLVKGSLESVDGIDNVNHFEPISVLAYSQMNYVYTVIPNSTVDVEGFRKESALSLERGQTFCSQVWFYSVYSLEYGNDCKASKNCSPLDGVLPGFMFFDDVQCSDTGKLRVLLLFLNSSYYMYDQPFGPGKMLVGEGVWSEDNHRLDVVACHVLNSMGSLNNVSVGNCSVRLSLWFPATLSIKSTSRVVGQLWSNKTVSEPGYFDKIKFQSSSDQFPIFPGLKYEYTEMARVLKSCPKKTAAKKGKMYPRGDSNDMRFNMRVRHNKGPDAWGYSVPLTVGDEFYQQSIEFRSYDDTTARTDFGLVRENQSAILNVSYRISLPPEYQISGAGSSPNVSLNLNAPAEISAEGMYDSETGNLCMVGCRYVKTLHNVSIDCEILIVVQFLPIDAKSSAHSEGTIHSTRESSDPLYFEDLQFSAISLYTGQVSESLWRMDFEIIMVLVSYTLLCIFVWLQTFYVKRHLDVLPSTSLFMLIILTLGQMIPLVLNFEALFVKRHDQPYAMMDSGGWLEVNEVLVRVITMVSFLLQFRLLQLTWSSRSGDANQKSLGIAEKKALYVLIPLYLVGSFMAWSVHWWNSSDESALHDGYISVGEGHSVWGDLRSYAGLLRDGFLLPQILFNLFWNSKVRSLHPAFYVGITSVRLLPHAYDLYRAHSYAHYYDAMYFYANPGGGLFSTAWDVIIPFGGVLLAIIIYLQQRFGGGCIVPPRFRQSVAYEKLSVVDGE